MWSNYHESTWGDTETSPAARSSTATSTNPLDVIKKSIIRPFSSFVIIWSMKSKGGPRRSMTLWPYWGLAMGNYGDHHR